MWPLLQCRPVVQTFSALQVDKGQTENAIQITGTSGVAVAFGIQSYLKNCCNIHVSWDGNQLSLPDILPQPQQRSVITSVGWYWQSHQPLIQILIHRNFQVQLFCKRMYAELFFRLVELDTMGTTHRLDGIKWY